MARAQGVTAFGPVSTAAELKYVIKEGLAAVKAGQPVVIDARITPGYTKAMSAGMTRTAEETAEADEGQ